MSHRPGFLTVISALVLAVAFMVAIVPAITAGNSKAISIAHVGAQPAATDTPTPDGFGWG
jgi:hypothetical protein